MQVFAVGRWFVLLSFPMQNLGFMAEKPRVGGREHEVTYSKKRDFCSQVISFITCQK